MADAETIARHLDAPPSRVPGAPESLRGMPWSIWRAVRAARACARIWFPAREAAAAAARPGRLIEYAATEWRPAVAAHRSESLRRAIDCPRRLVVGRRAEAVR